MGLDLSVPQLWSVLVFTWIGGSIASRAGAHPECD